MLKAHYHIIIMLTNSIINCVISIPKIETRLKMKALLLSEDECSDAKLPQALLQ